MIPKVYPLFIGVHNWMGKRLSLSSCETLFSTFCINPMTFKRMEMDSRITFNWLTGGTCLWALFLFAAFNFLLWSSTLSFWHEKVGALDFWKSFTVLSFARPILTVSFDKHSMLLFIIVPLTLTENRFTKCSFHAQNPIFSALLQIMSLYETCSVASSEYLSDVSKKMAPIA